MDTVAIDRARVVYYSFFSSLYAFVLDEEKFAAIVRGAELLAANPIDEQSARAFANMRRRLQKGGYAALRRESDRVFASPITALVPMTASFYHEQRDDGRKRVEMIDYVRQSKFRRNDAVYREHEDHIEFVLLFIGRMIEEGLAGDVGANQLARTVFYHILNEMVDQFGDALFACEQSFFYKQTVLALRSFIACERLYLDVSPPKKDELTASRHVVEKPQAAASAGCVRFNDTSVEDECTAGVFVSR
ncbi:MAG: molecular chaperone [Desulfopila sp.]